MGKSSLEKLARDIAKRRIRVIDLTQLLKPSTPVIQLPPNFAPSAPFSISEISRYDDRGPAWYWNNIACGEHTGTHFDAPIHWITGRDLPDASVDTIPPANFVAPACVIDVSAQCAENPDFTLEVEHLLAWERAHGEIPKRSWVLLRTDWSRRPARAYANMREDGAHTPGPSPTPTPTPLPTIDPHIRLRHVFVLDYDIVTRPDIFSKLTEFDLAGVTKFDAAGITYEKR